LLTTDGDTLKGAVQQLLNALLSAGGITDASLLDVDADPALRSGNANRREDLRIEWRSYAFLLNVAGREQFFKPTSLNQMSAHHRRYRTEVKSATTAQSLLIAHFNYGDGLDPRKRGQMFGTGTAEAQERLLAEGHGAIGTYDLYRIARAVQRGEVKLSAEKLLELLTTEGIFDYSKFVAASSPKQCT
jgi:hypothetical protein